MSRTLSVVARPQLIGMAVLTALIVAGQPARAALIYNAMDLGLPAGYTVGYNPQTVNNLGQCLITGGNTQIVRAFRTAPNTPINAATDDLGYLFHSSDYRYGTRMNDSGQVAGYAPPVQGLAWHAFRTAPNAKINSSTDDLGAPTGANSWANGINNSGQVVGYWLGDTRHAFRTAPNSPINPATDDLGTLSGSQAVATAINNLGQVVGAGGGGHAFRTAPNSAINPATDDLGTLGGTNGVSAAAINDAGQVVGDAWLAPGTFRAYSTFHAFRTGPNLPIDPATDDLGTFGGDNSQAYSINISGQVVGYAQTAAGTNSAFLYTGGSLLDLNTLTNGLPQGTHLDTAMCINNSGQIIAVSFATGGDHVFLLTPVPEPSSIGLLLLATMPLMWRRVRHH